MDGSVTGYTIRAFVKLRPYERQRRSPLQSGQDLGEHIYSNPVRAPFQRPRPQTLLLRLLVTLSKQAQCLWSDRSSTIVCILVVDDYRPV